MNSNSASVFYSSIPFLKSKSVIDLRLKGLRSYQVQESNQTTACNLRDYILWAFSFSHFRFDISISFPGNKFSFGGVLS